jgi:hypothetical protein
MPSVFPRRAFDSDIFHRGDYSVVLTGTARNTLAVFRELISAAAPTAFNADLRPTGVWSSGLSYDGSRCKAMKVVSWAIKNNA